MKKYLNLAKSLSTGDIDGKEILEIVEIGIGIIGGILTIYSETKNILEKKEKESTEQDELAEKIAEKVILKMNEKQND